MESSPVVQNRMTEVTSHRTSLRRCLEGFQSSEETMLPSARTPLWYRWAAIAALGVFLLAAVTIMSWWAGDTSSRLNRNNLIVAERTNARYESMFEEQQLASEKILRSTSAGTVAYLDMMRPWFPELSFLAAPNNGFEQLASVSQAIELEHFQPKFPS